MGRWQLTTPLAETALSVVSQALELVKLWGSEGHLYRALLASLVQELHMSHSLSRLGMWGSKGWSADLERAACGG